MIKIALFPLSNLLDGSKHLWAKIQGIAAHDAAATGNPVRIGGVYHSADPTGTDGDILDLRTNAKGELLTQLSGRKVEIIKTATITMGENNAANFGATFTNGVTDVNTLDVSAFDDITVYFKNDGAKEFTHVSAVELYQVNGLRSVVLPTRFFVTPPVIGVPAGASAILLPSTDRAPLQSQFSFAGLIVCLSNGGSSGAKSVTVTVTGKRRSA